MNSLEYLRQFKIGPFAIFDTVVSYIGILILSPLLNWLMSKIHIKVSLVSWMWLTIPISVLFHMAFSQSTALMKILSNPSDFQFYTAISVLIFMTYMGIKGISRI